MKKIFWRVALLFVITLITFTAVAGLIYTRFNRHNIMNLYKDELKSLASTVSEHVYDASEESDNKGLNSYLSALEDFGEIRNADIWIVSNPNSKTPLKEELANVKISDVEDAGEKTKALLYMAFQGKTKSYSSRDQIYELDIMHVATPILAQEGEVVGAVLVNGQMEYRESSLYQYQGYMTFSIVIAFLISLIVATYFSRRLVKPIIKLKEMAIDLSEGDYKKKSEVNRRDELGMLAQSMDILSDRLLEAEEFRDNLERNRRDFFSNVSHELRTPITVVKGYSELLADGIVKDEDKKMEYYERILHECTGMERLVSDLLILSKMQNPDFELEKEPINVIAVMQDSLRALRVIMDERNIFPELTYNDERSFVFGDYDRIRQLFVIILENAAKYADSDTKVDISIVRQDKKINITIEDEGIPIPESEWDAVFEKFYRANNHGGKDGSGLGLIVAKNIVERHSGRIWVDGDGVKKVAFHIELDETEIEE